MRKPDTGGREPVVPVRWRIVTLAPVLAVLVGAPLLYLLAGCDGDGDTGYNPYGLLAPLSLDWPRFRGADGQGVSTETGVPTTWDDATGQNILWKVSVPTAGEGSPVICGNRLFLSGATETLRKVFCFDITDGLSPSERLLWTADVVAPGEPRILFEGDYYAASSVVSDGVCVFAIFGNGDLACFDYEGTEVWVRNLGPSGEVFGPQIGYGHGSSLLVHNDRLIVQLDQNIDYGPPDVYRSRLLSINVRNGRTAWEKTGASRPVGSSWTTPIVISAAGKDQLITVSNPWVISYDAASGSEIWRSDCMSGDVVVSPIYVPPSGTHPNGLVVVVPYAAQTMAISPDATGEVTVPAWNSYDIGSGTPSPVTDGQYVYVVNEYGWLHCLNAASGNTSWPAMQDLSEAGVLYYPSPVLADGNVYLLRRDGKTVIFTAQGTSYQEIGRPQLGATETYDASPTIVDGRIYIRGSQNLYCIGN